MVIPLATVRAHWEAQYRGSHPIWDTGRPARELCRVVARRLVAPCRALELGCGTGTNAVWLARHGFRVTAVDLSHQAIAQARRKAALAAVTVDFRVGDLADPTLLTGPFDFFFDCGCYGATRRVDAAGYLRTLARVLRPGAHGLLLVGNAHEPEDAVGPPVMSEAQLYRELEPGFTLMRLRPFRFDARPRGKRYLGWACLLRRRNQTLTWSFQSRAGEDE
ncbi:MAG TPA: class I SAM-dependent methyltransferase [Gemmataceae bacterium]|nr:class I SAM-dependent methyltransferase [Gemmataceae bacterium]